MHRDKAGEDLKDDANNKDVAERSKRRRGDSAKEELSLEEISGEREVIF